VTTVLATFDIQPGREHDFEELWHRERPTREHAPGFRAHRLLRHTDQPGRYLVVHEWDNRELFDAHMRAIGVVWLLDDTTVWVAPPSFSYWEEVGEVAPTS
jgi:quinol monooxygenase YgiN